MSPSLGLFIFSASKSHKAERNGERVKKAKNWQLKVEKNSFDKKKKKLSWNFKIGDQS